MLEKYAEFVDSSESYVASEALKVLFRQDDEFKAWPGPPKLVGAFLVVSITVGYMATDKLISTKGPASTRDMCGGPTGDVVSAPRSCESLNKLHGLGRFK